MSTIEIPDADHWTLGPIKLDLTFDSKPMRDSLASVLAELEVLAASGDALEYVVDLADGMIARDGSGGLDLCFDGEDLIAGEAIHFPATDARPFETVQVPPSDRYLRLVAALASDRDTYCVRFVHGWPVLSVDVRPTTVADRELAGNASLVEPAA